MNILNNENEDPQFVLLSEKNKDEFLVWCLTKLWEDNLKINDEFLNYYMELKMKEWIEQYHPWLYCYTCIKDEFNSQKKEEEKEKKRLELEKKRLEKEKMRPTDINKRRELFAKKFETKFNNSKFKKKKKR
tara:strand:- start:1562 stop:1954 length:393 start_codon:yes stop_codon:yes gene_type:complete